MRQVRLGQTDLQVSRIAFGTWAFGGDWGASDLQDSKDSIHRALELGINLFDTAQGYGFGVAEQVLGEALRERTRREDVVIATKGGLHMEGGRRVRDASGRWLRAGVEASLRSLGTDYIDIYQVHWPDLHTPPEETAEVLGELVREGKIRHAGVSNYDVDQIAALGRYGRVDTLQPPYHLFRREIEDKVLPYTAEHDIGVLIYGPLAHGLLAGRMTPSTTFEPDDWRSKSPDFSGETFRRNLAVVERLKGFARQRDVSLPELAVAWTLAHPGVHVEIVGARRRPTSSSPDPTSSRSRRSSRMPCPCGARTPKTGREEQWHGDGDPEPRGGRGQSGKDPDRPCARRPRLAANLPGRAGVVGGDGGGHLRDPQPQPGPHRDPHRQLPGPGHLRRLRLPARRRGRERPAHLHGVHLRRHARGARRLAAGSGIPEAADRRHLRLRRADRGGGQAGGAVADRPAPAPLHHARRDRAGRRRRLRLRGAGERGLRLQRAVHSQRALAHQPGRDRGAARHPRAARARAVDRHPRRSAVRHRGTARPATADRRRRRLVPGGRRPAHALGLLAGNRGVAHPAADRHPGAVADDPARPDPRPDAGAGPPVHRAELDAPVRRRPDRSARPPPQLAPRDRD